jgi:hypothetical protein
MKSKLSTLELHRSTVPEEQIIFLKKLFMQGNCLPLIDYAKKETENPGHNDSSFIFESIFEFAFEYAIENKAHEFISDLINHSTIMIYLNHVLLLNYMSTVNDVDFKKRALIAMANAPSTPDLRQVSVGDFYFRWIRRALSGAKRSKEDLEHELYIRILLQSSEINAKERENYLKEWVRTYCYSLDSTENNEIITDIFFRILPDVSSHLLAIYEIIFSTCLGTTLPVALNMFTKKYPLSCELAGKLLESQSMFWRSQDDRLITLIQQLDQSHSNYIIYTKILKYLKLTQSLRARFIVDNPEIIFDETITYNIKMAINVILTEEDRQFIIEHYIVNPDFLAGSFFVSYLIHCSEETIINYLSATTTITPRSFLSDLIHGRAMNDPVDIIALLIARSDYTFENEEIFGPLVKLFRNGYTQSIAKLLSHPAVFNLLKHYESLKGDSYLRIEDHGKLLPAAMAWYLVNSNKAEELFFAQSEKTRKEMLKCCVPGSIDPSQPTLKFFMIQKGSPEIIAAMGGVYPRLVKAESSDITVFIPTFWRNPKITHKLTRLQKKYSIKVAKKRSEMFHYVKEADNELQKMVSSIVNNIDLGTLLLHHLTTKTNAEFALAENRLKSRLHIQGHSLYGKASKGLMTEGLESDHPNYSFCFFIHAKNLNNDKKTSHYKDKKTADKAKILLNAKQLFIDNPHINFIVIGFYPYLVKQEIKLPSGYCIDSTIFHYPESAVMSKIEFKTADTMTAIFQRLLELAVREVIDKIKGPEKIEIIKRLTQPENEEDYQFIRDFIYLLPLEWLIPGDVPIKFSYVESVELGETSYNIAKTRKIVLNADEEQIIAEIDKLKPIMHFPFLINGILEIAMKRDMKAVIRQLFKHQQIPSRINISYQPKTVYQCESLFQLIIEDFNNDRQYVHLTGDTLTFYATLTQNSNRSGAHHAEMAKLYHALGVGDTEGGNGLQMQFDDTLNLKLDVDDIYQSLAKIRDTLLTYELTTLLVSDQNLTYYKNQKGQFHPKTGRGATNGRVALMKDRLFYQDEPYHINAKSDFENQIKIECTNAAVITNIARVIANVLKIDDQYIIIEPSGILLMITIDELIIKLSQQAICYEGINVLTTDGRLLVANRINKGRASAGGHHDKYSQKGIAYGLYSEFGLIFNTPEAIEQQVTLLSGIKTISKTGIYVVSYDDLTATNAAKLYASEQGMSVAFKADPFEFESNSEEVLTLVDMRHKLFYDVMPLKELCQYQLNKLKSYLQRNLPDLYEAITLCIDDSVDTVISGPVAYKIPTTTFGQMTITVDKTVLDQFNSVFGQLIKMSQDSDTEVIRYSTEETPLAVLSAIKEAVECDFNTGCRYS